MTATERRRVGWGRRVAGPLVVALLLAGWVAWTQADPARQGGYCTNVTIAMAELLNADPPAGSAVAPESDLALFVTDPDGVAGRLQSRLPRLDVARLRADPPAEVRAAVAVLDRALPTLGSDPSDEATAAFSEVVRDYQRRCLYLG